MLTAKPIAGTLVFLLGGIAAATYLLPFRGVKGWAYETGWLVSVLAGWFVFPLVFDAVVVPDFWNVLGAAPAATLFRSFGFGVLWGVGALCWALMVRYLGFGLGLGIGAGLCAATGTLLPPIFTGHAADLVATPSARMVLGGVGIALLGIVAVGIAGRLKEGEMSEEAKKKAVAEFDFKKGLVTAIIAGVASAGINFGLQGAPELEKAALASGASPTWAGMPILTVVLWGGLVTQIVWVGWKWKSGKVSSSKLLLVSCAMKRKVALFFTPSSMPWFTMFTSSIVAPSAVFFSAILGVFLGEWKGTSWRTKTLLSSGIVILAVGFTVMALGGK